MVFASILNRFRRLPRVRCLEPTPKSGDELDDETPSDESEHSLPTFKSAAFPIRVALLDAPNAQPNGFAFALASAVNPQFNVTQEIAMPPTTKSDQSAFDAPRPPFYALSAQYHSGEFGGEAPKHNFSLVGRVDSNANVQSVFYKPIGRRAHVRLLAAMPSAAPALAHYDAELEGEAGDARYALAANSESVEASFAQRIGARLLVASQLAYVAATRSLSNAFLLRFARAAGERYFLQFSEATRVASLAMLARVDDKTSIATELQVSAATLASTAALGYRRVGRRFEVTSALRTNGDVRSAFGYAHSAFRLRLFLGANLFGEDFRSGYSLTIGGD